MEIWEGGRPRAVHRDGVLELLTPLGPPEGAQVSVIKVKERQDQVLGARAIQLPDPVRWVSGARLDLLGAWLRHGAIPWSRVRAFVTEVDMLTIAHSNTIAAVSRDFPWPSPVVAGSRCSSGESCPQVELAIGRRCHGR